VGYKSKGTRISSVSGTGEMDYGGLQCVLPVEWNREIFSFGYRWNGKEVTQCGSAVDFNKKSSVRVPVEWKRILFSMGTGGMEQEGLNFGLRDELNRDVFSL